MRAGMVCVQGAGGLVADKKLPERMEDVIVAYLKMLAKDNPRPLIKDETWQRMFAGELAGKIRKWESGK
jgi:hypothetical protein